MSISSCYSPVSALRVSVHLSVSPDADTLSMFHSIRTMEVDSQHIWPGVGVGRQTVLGQLNTVVRQCWSASRLLSQSVFLVYTIVIVSHAKAADAMANS